MNSYLQLKFKNGFNENFSLRINNYNPEVTDAQINQAMDRIVASGIFTGKKSSYDQKVSASLVTIQEKEYDLE
ncbi:MAG: DUF2922 domain-containing protein [Finegoldia sp.]|nr:DUF2922 domain-containing protein [Finegoldia sp.]